MRTEDLEVKLGSDQERSFASRATCLESQARTTLPKNERGTAPEKTLWSNFRG